MFGGLASLGVVAAAVTVYHDGPDAGRWNRMSRLQKELGLLQGIGLLATSLLGTGIFVVPATAAALAGRSSLWAWGVLILLGLPLAFTFARLGRRSPHAGGAPHLVGLAFGAGAERFSAFLFLAVLPVGLPAALNIASGFWPALRVMNAWALWGVQRFPLLRQSATGDCVGDRAVVGADLAVGGSELARWPAATATGE